MKLPKVVKKEEKPQVDTPQKFQGLDEDICAESEKDMLAMLAPKDSTSKPEKKKKKKDKKEKTKAPGKLSFFPMALPILL